MDLLKEILIEVLAKEEIHVVLPRLSGDALESAEMICYQALKKIRAILRDNSLDDAECFIRIEKIIKILEEIGSNGGDRHDFG